MSNLFGMIYTGVTGIMAAQVQLDVTGHNVANMNNPNYTRQRVNLASAHVSVAQNGTFGTGVKVVETIRIYDEILAKTLRNEQNALSYWESSQMVMENVKMYFNELEQDYGSGLGEPLNNYFDAWNDLGNTAPDNSEESAIRRTQLVQATQTLTTSLKTNRAAFTGIQKDIDEHVKMYVESINMMSSEIALLNKEVMRIEAGGENANDLRDSRDALVKKMTAMVNTTVNENPRGDITITIAGMPVVEGDKSYKLFAESNPANNGKVDIYWSTDEWYDKGKNITSKLSGGSLTGELDMRDKILEEYIGKLDDLAYNIVAKTNELHSTGQGLVRYDRISAPNAAINPRFTLSTDVGGLPYEIKKGTFQIKIYDSNNVLVDTYSVGVDPKVDTLNGIAEKISLADGDLAAGIITASVTKTGEIQIGASSGYTFSFGSDTSNFLSAAGFNSFFTGTNADNIELNSFLGDNPHYIVSKSEGGNGNNDIALRIAELKNQKVVQNGTIKFEEFYGLFAGRIATDKQQIDTFVLTRTMSVTEYEKKMQSISGVVESEELINMDLFQRIFEANSRYINAVDSMLERVVNSLGLVGR